MKKLLILLTLLVSITFIDVNAEENNDLLEENQTPETEEVVESTIENEQPLTGLQVIDGKIYYLNEETGEPEIGFKTVGDDLYFFSSKDKAASQGWKAAYGNVWYQNEEGKVVRGLQNIDGKNYFFNEKTGFREVGFKTVGEDLYFFSSIDKYASPGWKAAYGQVWYQNEEGKVVRGIQTVDGKKYFFNEKTGYREVGFKQVGEDLYFFSSKDKSVSPGWKAAYGNVWYQNEEGKVVKGLQNIDGKNYFFNEQTGYREVGFKTIGEDIYFFSSVDKYASPGWKSAYGNIWYQNEEGKLVKGLQTIDSRDYKFNEETGYLDGFKIENGKKYYYNPDGTQAKGIQYMANQHWKFNEITGAFEKIVRQIRVIDISTHNGDIDWNKVKASGMVDAVILRVGYGQRWIDDRFEYNKNELERLGIPYSIYLFSYAENGSEALKESNFVINAVRDYNIRIATNIFSIYYDLESWYIKSTGESSDNISKDKYREMITTFVDNIERNLCIKARVYASKNFIETRFPSDVQHYATWVAQWSNQITYQGPYEGWQYTSKGDIPGIPWGYDDDGNYGPHTDMSIFYY